MNSSKYVTMLLTVHMAIVETNFDDDNRKKIED